MDSFASADIAKIIKQDPQEAAKFLDHLVDKADLQEGDPRLNSLVQQLVDQDCPGGVCTATQERVQALVEATNYDKVYNGPFEEEIARDEIGGDNNQDKKAEVKPEAGIVITSPVEKYNYDCTNKKDCKKLKEPEEVVEAKSLVSGKKIDIELDADTDPKVGDKTVQNEGLVKVAKVKILDTKAIIDKRTNKLIPAPDSKEVVLDGNDQEQVGKLNFVSDTAKDALMQALPKAEETASAE